MSESAQWWVSLSQLYYSKNKNVGVFSQTSFKLYLLITWIECYTFFSTPILSTCCLQVACVSMLSSALLRPISLTFYICTLLALFIRPQALRIQSYKYYYIIIDKCAKCFLCLWLAFTFKGANCVSGLSNFFWGGSFLDYLFMWNLSNFAYICTDNHQWALQVFKPLKPKVTLVKL